MDSGKEHLGSEIVQTGKCLMELLQKNLCPDFVRAPEEIALAAPWDEADYRVGIYLYDIQDYSICRTQESVINESLRRLPPKAVELSYLVFCNEKHRFGGLQREQLHAVLNEVIRTIYDILCLRAKMGRKWRFPFCGKARSSKSGFGGAFTRRSGPRCMYG